MGRLDPEARMAIKALAARGATQSEIARLLGVTEGAVRYHARRMAVGAVDGRARQEPKAEAVAAAIEHWRGQQDGGGDQPGGAARRGCGGSMAMTAACARCSGTGGAAYPAPAVRARRRVETPPGAQAQVDWAHFPARDRRRRGGRPGGAAHGAVVEPEGGDRLGADEGHARLARLPHGLLRPARRRAGDGAHRQREDRDRPRRRRLGHDQPDLPALCGG